MSSLPFTALTSISKPLQMGRDRRNSQLGGEIRKSIHPSLCVAVVDDIAIFHIAKLGVDLGGTVQVREEKDEGGGRKKAIRVIFAFTWVKTQSHKTERKTVGAIMLYPGITRSNA